MSLGWEFSVQVSVVLAFHRGSVQLGSPLELLLFLPTSLPLQENKLGTLGLLSPLPQRLLGTPVWTPGCRGGWEVQDGSWGAGEEVGQTPAMTSLPSPPCSGSRAATT